MTVPTLNLPHIITDNETLRRFYNRLQPGDIMLGRVRLRPSEEHLLVDLLERGVILYPSALSQLASRSKAFQARLFAKFMLPQTLAIHDQHDILAAVNDYDGIGSVVTKLDRKNGGMGIHLWPGIEAVYSQASLGVLPFPFVVQPFLEDSGDIRVIFLGDYHEAYTRHNPDNFRNNLHCGGSSESRDLSDKQLRLCRQVMERGKFPYAHIDLMVKDEHSYLAEINLRGGLRGAAISPANYRLRIEDLEKKELERMRKCANKKRK